MFIVKMSGDICRIFMNMYFVCIYMFIYVFINILNLK